MTHYLRRMVFAVLVCGAGWFITAAGQEPGAQLAPTVPDEVIVQFRPQAAQRKTRRDRRRSWRPRPAPAREPGDSACSPCEPRGRMEAEIAALQNDPDVVAVQPNFIREITRCPNDPVLDEQQSLGPPENTSAVGMVALNRQLPGRRRRHRHRRQLHPSRSRAEHVAEPRRNRRRTASTTTPMDTWTTYTGSTRTMATAIRWTTIATAPTRPAPLAPSATTASALRA